MRIATRLGIGYGIMSAICLLLLAWLAYQEFVVEAARFAARGVSELHEDTSAEFFTVCFLGLIPLLLGLGWWWTRRALAPLTALIQSVEKIEPNHPQILRPTQGTHANDEVAVLEASFASMTARLDESFQQIRQFTLQASHELKTPLTVMRAQFETIRRENAALPATRTEWVEDLLDEVLRLAKIVDSLSLLTKADAGIVELEREPVLLGHLVQEAFEDALIMAQGLHLNVTLDQCADAPVMGERHRLRQLLLILTDNAVKYNKPDGRILISLREQNGAAELRVTNDGGGFSPQTQGRLFNRFVRGENAVGKVEGCGLGLAIAQWIVQAHNGTIALRPEAGDRTTAFVRIPLYPALIARQAAAA